MPFVGDFGFLLCLGQFPTQTLTRTLTGRRFAKSFVTQRRALWAVFELLFLSLWRQLLVLPPSETETESYMDWRALEL